MALVIGNSAYEKAAPLANPVNDATDMASKLEAIGFEVHRGLNLNSNDMRNLIVRFGRATETADIALFFYAGHGIQAGGENYLVPIEAEIEFENEIGLTLIPTTQVLDQLGRAKSSRLVFLDACRDNPFKRQLMKSMGTRSATSLHSGLSQPRKIPDTYIAYATQPDAVADDGSGRNSPFTAALLKYIDEPGLSVHDLMLKVGNDVRAATGERQEPWSASTLRHRFFFVPTTLESATVGPSNVMDRFTAASELSSRTGWQEFIKDFEGDPAAQRYVKIARKELKKSLLPLERPDTASIPPAWSGWTSSASQPEHPDTASVPSADAEAPPEKFLQRLLPDGSETLDSPSVQTVTGEASVAMKNSADVASNAQVGAHAAHTKQERTTQEEAIFSWEKSRSAPASVEPGTVAWFVAMESPGGDMPPEPAIRADATIPGEDLQLRLTIRRNADKTLPASHVVELIFLTPDGFKDGEVDDVPHIVLKSAEQKAGSQLVGISAKIADGFFLVALDETKAEIDTNLSLLRQQSWIDIPVVYKSGRRALFTLKRGQSGEAVITDTLSIWEAVKG